MVPRTDTILIGVVFNHLIIVNLISVYLSTACLYTEAADLLFETWTLGWRCNSFISRMQNLHYFQHIKYNDLLGIVS